MRIKHVLINQTLRIMGIKGAEKDLDGFQAGELLLPDTEFLFTKDTLLKSPLEKWQVLGIGEKIAFYVFWSGDKNLKY